MLSNSNSCQTSIQLARGGREKCSPSEQGRIDWLLQKPVNKSRAALHLAPRFCFIDDERSYVGSQRECLMFYPVLVYKEKKNSMKKIKQIKMRPLTIYIYIYKYYFTLGNRQIEFHLLFGVESTAARWCFVKEGRKSRVPLLFVGTSSSHLTRSPNRLPQKQSILERRRRRRRSFPFVSSSPCLSQLWRRASLPRVSNRMIGKWKLHARHHS